jgi:hypothetical protein
MIFSSVRVKDHTQRLRKKVFKGATARLYRAGAYVRKVAQNSIRKSEKASKPGKPPHTRKGQLKRAVEFDVNEAVRNVVIGPRASWITTIGSTHEFGKTETKEKKSSFANWRIKEGGHGPVEGRLRKMFGRNGKPEFEGLRFAKLDTGARVAKARRLIAGFNEGRAAVEIQEGGMVRVVVRGPRRYPERQFMGRALAVSARRIPTFWSRSVIGG